MRSLSSTVSEMPSSWLPSRRVVSKISTDAGRGRTPGAPVDTRSFVDMVQPFLVAVDLAPHRGEERLLDLAGDGPGLADLAVVDRADRHDLRGRAGQERLVAGVEVAPQDVPLL